MAQKFRASLDEYAAKYASFLAFTYEDGILEARLHTEGGPFRWNLDAHRGLIPAMADINNDPDVECLIVTGTGDAFISELDVDNWREHGFMNPFSSYQAYDIMYHDQTREPFALLDLKIPVIAAVNGPVILHAELALLNDIVICADHTYFYEGHWDGMGIVPGDGVHTLFRELLGQNRGRYFLLMGQKIAADEALRLGLVGEVLPAAELLPRAWEIARTVFMTKNRVQRRLTRGLLTQPWRELYVKEISRGMAHEALGCFNYWPMADEPDYDVANIRKADPAANDAAS